MSDEQRCKTCIWWLRPGEEDYEEAVTHLRGVRLGGRGLCGWIGSSPGSRRAEIVQSGEPEYLYLLTEPDFGCVDWKGDETRKV